MTMKKYKVLEESLCNYLMSLTKGETKSVESPASFTPSDELNDIHEKKVRNKVINKTYDSNQKRVTTHLLK